MADFGDVVKGLKENKDTTDAGFTRLEKAIAGTDSKSQLEEKAKQDANEKKKELSYFAGIRSELEEANAHLSEGFSNLQSPTGALGGLLGLIAAPVFIITGFLKGLADSFKFLGLDIKKLKFVKTIGDFFKTTLPNTFKNIFNAFKGGRLEKIFKSLKSGFKFVMQPFIVIGDIIKMFMGGAGKIGGAIKSFSTTFKAITGFASSIGKILGRLFLPITFIITAFDTIMGAIDGFKTDGVLGGFMGAIKGFLSSIVTKPLDLLKSGVSWILGKLGFDQAEKFLDSFSFTKIFTDLMDKLTGILVAGKDWVVDFFTNFSFTELFQSMANSVMGFLTAGKDWVVENLNPMKIIGKIGELLSEGFDFVTEMAKSLQRTIHGALNFVKSLFGFGDKGDFADAEMPVTKDVRAFLTFEWVNDLLKPVTDFFKSIMDFDFMGFIKKIPGVGALLDYISGDDTPKDEVEIENDRQKRINELKKLIRTDSLMTVGLSADDEKAELAKLEKESKEHFKKIRAESADKGNLKTANLVGRKPTDGSDFKDVDPSEMTREQLRAALIDYNREKDKYKGGRRKMFDRRNTKLRQALSRRRLEFKREDRDIAEEENQASYTMTQAALDKIVVGGGGSTTVVNNTNNSPVNNNTKTTTLSPLVQVDPVMKAAIGADF